MKAEQIERLNELKIKCLTQGGELKKRAKKEDLEELAKLQAEFDNEHALEVPDGTQITQPGRPSILNVCGRQQIVYGP